MILQISVKDDKAEFFLQSLTSYCFVNIQYDLDSDINTLPLYLLSRACLYK